MEKHLSLTVKVTAFTRMPALTATGATTIQELSRTRINARSAMWANRKWLYSTISAKTVTKEKKDQLNAVNVTSGSSLITNR